MQWVYLNSDLKASSFESDKTGYIYGSNYLSNPLDSNKSIIAAFDLDSTLIRTKSGKTFSTDYTDYTDWEWLYSVVPQTLLKYSKYRIMIITNQSGIKQDVAKLNAFKLKLDAICNELNKLNIEVFCFNHNNVFRKPFPTSITSLNLKHNFESFYCGDAANRFNDFAASDIQFAFNSRLKFYTPENMFLKDKSRLKIYPTKFKKYTNGIRLDKYTYKPIDSSPELIIMVGYPGSGKSHIANMIYRSNLLCDTFEEFKSRRKMTILSQDALGSKSNLYKHLKKSADLNHSIIIDNSNLKAQDRLDLIDLVDLVSTKYKIRIIQVLRSLDESYHLNCLRYFRNYKTDTKFVPMFVYKMMDSKFDTPSRSESDRIDRIDRLIAPSPIDEDLIFIS